MSSRLEELETEKANLEAAYQNILEAGQEFQTRDGRVKQASLSTIMERLNTVRQEIAALKADGTGMTDTVLMKWGGM